MSAGRHRRPARIGSGDSGTILIEAVVLVALLSLPVFYLVATLARLQAGAYAVSATAREGGRAYVTSAQADLAPGRAAAAAGLVLDAHGFTPEEGTLAFSCSADPCLRPGSTVRVDSTVQVALPLIPDFMDGILPMHVELSSSHVEAVEEFRER